MIVGTSLSDEEEKKKIPLRVFENHLPAFIENTRNNICSNSAQKPIREVDASSYLSQDIILTY